MSFGSFFPLNKDSHPFVLGAIKLYGNLCLLKGIFSKASGAQLVNMFLEFATDNQGNSFSLLNQNTRRWPSSAMLMEIMLQAYDNGCFLAPRHSYRESNTWADAAAGGDSEGFDPAKQWLVPEENWILLSNLLNVGGNNGPSS